MAAEVRRRVGAGELLVSRLAERAGLAQPTVSNWLCGRRCLSMEALEDVRAALGLGLCELVRCDRAECPAWRRVDPPAPASRPKQVRAPWRRRVDPVEVEYSGLAVAA